MSSVAVIACRIDSAPLTEAKPRFVGIVAITETVWVRERAYGLSDARICAVIEMVRQTDVLEIQQEQAVFAAMAGLKAGRGSFADALIAFDRKALRRADMASASAISIDGIRLHRPDPGTAFACRM